MRVVLGWDPNTYGLSLYAISDPIMVPVPEPSSLASSVSVLSAYWPTLGDGDAFSPPGSGQRYQSTSARCRPSRLA